MLTKRCSCIGIAAGAVFASGGMAQGQLVTQDLAQGLTPEDLVATLVE